MKSIICLMLVLSLCCKVVFCDENCDNVTRSKIEDYVTTISSTDLIVCSESTHVKCGEDYAPALLEKPPTLKFDVGNSCEFSTVIFFGNYTEANSTATVLLWVVYNVPSSDLKSGFDGQSGRKILGYKMPKDSPTTVDHFFFVYCQDSKMESFECCSQEQQTNIDLKQLAEKNHLKLEIPAALYFQVSATDQLMDKEPVKDEVCSANIKES